MKKSTFPVIKELSDDAYKVGEIRFPPEWIPEGNYTGVVKELKEAMGDYRIQLVYIPSVDDHILVYLPPLVLPSGFDATPFPRNVRRHRRAGEDYYLNCGVGKETKHRDSVFEFDGRGDYVGICRSDKKEMMNYIKELRELFESDGTETINGIDAIRLRKVIRGLSVTRIEQAKKMLREHNFKGATFHTDSHRISGQKEFVSQFSIDDACVGSDFYDDRNFELYASYEYSDDRFEGSPNIVSILLYSGSNSVLAGNGLEFLEEFAHLF